jgi:hypothetical protein
MIESDPASDKTLRIAVRVAGILDQLGVPCALIGAAALAAHGYPRATEDIDMAVATDPFTTLAEAQRRIALELQVEAKLVTPDADDPLGGVLTVTGDDFDPVQVVNFLNPLSRRPNPGSEAVRTATAGLVTGTPLRLVTLPYLVALKLFAGGYKSKLDVLELLSRNPAAPRDEVARVCAAFGLDGDWNEIARELSH